MTATPSHEKGKRDFVPEESRRQVSLFLWGFEMHTKFAYSKREALDLIPWGRNKFDDDIRDGICESFRVGRRVYVTEKYLREYVEKRIEMDE